MNKRFIAMMLSVMVVMSFILPVMSNSSTTRERLSEITIGETVNLGEPLQERYVDNSVLSKLPNGDNIIGATISGSPAIFYVYNLDTNEIIGQWEIQGAVFAHGHATAPNGDIYISTHEYAKLCRFNVSDQTFEDLGALPQRDFVAYQPCFDDSGENVYVGTYANAYLYGYNIRTKTWREYGTIFPNQKYNKALAYHNGFVYCGGNGSETSDAKFVKVNVATGEIIDLPNPAMGVFADNEGNSLISKYQYMDKITDSFNGTTRNFIGAYASPKGTGYCGIFFDLDNEVWLENVVTGYYGQQFTNKTDNGKTYFLKNNSLNKPSLHSFDFRTNLITDERLTINREAEFQVQPKGAGLCELKDQINFPGKSYITVFYTNGTPAIFNLEKKAITYLEDIPLRKAAIEVRDVGGGIEGYIGMGAYKGRQAVLYDISKANAQNPTESFSHVFPFHQPEAIGGYNGKMYYSQYSGGSLYELDPSKPAKLGENPKFLTQLIKNVDGKNVYMDRIFDLAFGDDLVVMSGFPSIDSTKGGFGYYNLKTGETVFEYNIIPNQSVNAVFYKDNKIYGATHIWGGTNTYPVADQAKIFVYDTKTRTLTKELALEVSSISPAKPLHIGGMEEGEDGRLWAIVGGTLVGMNMETLDIEKEIKISNFTLVPESKQYFPYCLEKLNNGLMVGTFKDGITIVDIYTGQFKKIADTAFRFDIASDNNIYYTEGRNLKKIPITYNTDITPPTKISDLSMESYDRSVTVSWTDPYDTDLKDVFLSLEQEDSTVIMLNYPVGKGVGSYTILNLKDNTKYIAKIYTKDVLGNKSDISKANITTSDNVAPNQVSNLKFFPINGKIKYAFTQPSNFDYSKTKVSVSNGYEAELLKGTSKGEITALSSNTTYSITIESFDEGGNKTLPIITNVKTPSLAELNESISVNENFESEIINNEPQLWDTSSSPGGVAKVVIDPLNQQNKTIGLFSSTGTVHIQRYLSKNLSTRQLISFNFMSKGINSKIGFFSNDLFSSTRKVIEVGVMDNQFYYWNDIENKSTNLSTSFSPDIWYTLEIIHKIDLKSADLYINGIKSATIPFNKATIGSIVASSYSQDNILYLDNFKIEATTMNEPPSAFANVIGYATSEEILASAHGEDVKQELLKWVVKDNYAVPPNMTVEEWEKIKPRKATFKLDKEYNGSKFIILDVDFKIPE